MLGGADAQQGGRRDLGRKGAASPHECPALHGMWGAGSGSSQGRPGRLQAMHQPGTCSAARDAAGLEPVPRAGALQWRTRPLSLPQPLPSRWSLLLSCPSPTPRQDAILAPWGWSQRPPPPGREPLGRHSPIGGVASVCRPTSWPGPSPSRKSLNWLSAPSRVVGKMNLCRGERRAFVGLPAPKRDPPGAQGGCPAPGPDPRATPRCLTCRRSCCCWCCRRWTPGCLAG